MNKLKKTKIFSLGRKWVFTLALFLFVFAAASVVKIHAGTGDSVTGWLWGGGVGTIGDGTNTNVRWISMNNTNPGTSSPYDYGVNIPNTDGPVMGYAWSGGDASGPGIGWIDFNPQDHCTTGAPGAGQYKSLSCTPNSGSAGVFRSGDKLIGWARIVGIAQESAVNNSGGWSGWIHMDGNYGVDLTKMTGIPGAKPLAEMTFATAGADELGWIDFSGAKYTETSTLDVKPNPLTLQSGNNPGALFATLTKSSGPIDGKQIKFTILPGGSPKISLKSSTCTTGATGSGECSISAIASDLVTDGTAQVQAECADSSCSAIPTTINIKHTPNCTISCPDSFTVAPDGVWYPYSCDVSSPTGDACNVDSCTKLSGGSSKISIQKGAGNTCEVKADTSARYDTAVSHATAGIGSYDTNINVKNRGWIETTP